MSISQKNYDELKKKYGKVASWAIWAQPDEGRPASKTGCLSVFEDPDLLQKLNTGFVFVALNDSGVSNGHDPKTENWYNFHSCSPYQKDYKLRYAIMGTRFEGSYITDIIKNHQEIHAENVVKEIKDNRKTLKKNIDIFKDELRLLGGKPVILALGAAAYKFLQDLLSNEYQIIRVTHYAARIGKERYKEELLDVTQSFISL